MADYVTIVGFLCHDNITIDLEFSDGTHQLVDVGAFIRRHPHPQYDKYLKPSNFRKCRLEFGNVCWGNDLEFHIEDLYQNVISAQRNLLTPSNPQSSSQLPEPNHRASV